MRVIVFTLNSDEQTPTRDAVDTALASDAFVDWVGVTGQVVVQGMFTDGKARVILENQHSKMTLQATIPVA